MAGLAIAILFLLMVAAPCLVALRSSRAGGDIEEFVPEEYEAEEFEPIEPVRQEIAPEPVVSEPPAVPVAARTSSPNVRSAAKVATALSLREMAVEAEIAALMAKDRADRAHWEALTAAATAAALRADATAEAAQAAGLAADRPLWAAETESDYEAQYPQENHPSLNFPRVLEVARRAA